MIKDDLQHIIQGTGRNSQNSVIQTISNYLRASQNTSTLAKNHKQYKQEEAKRLIKFCKENNLWIDHSIDASLFISEGAEQKVFIKNNKTVYKLNDGIYYLDWLDYLINLQLHNYFFPETSYNLIGFCQIENIFFALVEQPFVRANEPTNLDLVKQFMLANGFINTRNHDYFNNDLGIIIEDLHDENVLTFDGILYFIDTVFYIKI